MDCLFRAEKPSDYGSVRALHRFAFNRDNEAQLVETLRAAPGHIPELSLVAEVGGQIVGHILFSPIVIRTAQEAAPALALAPMAVLPAYQRRGIGSQLVRVGLDACRRLKHTRVVVLGHPAFYARFGFVRASQRCVRAPFDVPDESFMVCELTRGSFKDCAGVVEYSPAFASV